MTSEFKASISALALAAGLAGCATPHASLYAATGPHGTFPVALPRAEITITESRAPDEHDDNVVHLTFDVTSSVQNSRFVYFIEPENLRWRETRLAPIYFDNTSVLKTLTVETVDRRASFVQSLVSVAGRLGADLTTFETTMTREQRLRQPLCNYTLTAEDINQLLTISDSDATNQNGADPGASEGEGGSITRGACSIQAVEVGRLPERSIPRAEFERSYLEHVERRQGDPPVGYRESVPYAACRRVVLLISDVYFPSEAAFRAPVNIPDARYVRTAPLPYHATMNFESICSVPSTTDANAPEKTDLEVLNEILTTLSDPE